MANPIQYTPQFVPTNVGLMNQQLGQMQQRHDQSQASVGQFEDKYSQMMVDPSDIAGKNAVLGGIQDRITKIVDRYGGDYGAASKDIAREITKAKKDPFFQLAPYKMAIAEEQRKQINKLGPNAIIGKDVANVQVFNPETGEHASKEDLASRVLDKRAFQKQLEDEFGGLGSQVRETKLTRNKDFKHLLDEITYKGLYQNEVAGKATEMKRLLMQDQDMPEAVADEMANNYANQLAQGYQTSHIQDPLYLANEAAKKKKVEQEAATPRNYILSQGSGKETGWTPESSIKNVDEYSKVLQDYNAAKVKAKNAPTYGSEYTKAKDSQFWNDYVADSKRKYNNVLDKFKGEMFDDLTKNNGLTEEQAIKVVANEKSSKPMTHPTEFIPSADKSKDGILSDLKRSLSGIPSIPGITRRKRDGESFISGPIGGSYDDEMKDAIYDGKIIDIKFDLKNKDMILIDKDGNSYKAPVNTLGNKGTAENFDSYNNLINTLYSDKQTTSSEVAYVNGIPLAASVSFNPELNNGIGGYERKLYVVNPQNRTKQPIEEEQLNDIFASSLFGSYGQSPQYKPTYINQ